MSARIFIWVQHLLGFGHFARTKVIAESLRDAGYAVTLVSGGKTPAAAISTGIEFVQLPPVRAKNELFDELVDDEGRDVGPSWLTARRDVLMRAFEAAAPDMVITETFPFGRRLLELELAALLHGAREAPQRPKIAASVRDVLQRPRKLERAIAMVERARQYFDAVIVHGDPSLIKLQESFPEVSVLADRIKYTGYVCAAMPEAANARLGVIVSAGGGAAGEALLQIAQAARPHSRLRDRHWTFVTGPLVEASVMRSDEQTTIVQSLPDFKARLTTAEVAVGQAGYNTLIECICARVPTLAIPFETDREQEQVTRARVLARHGLIHFRRSCDIDPRSLAGAIDETAMMKISEIALNVDGKRGVVRAVGEILRQ